MAQLVKTYAANMDDVYLTKKIQVGGWTNILMPIRNQPTYDRVDERYGVHEIYDHEILKDGTSVRWVYRDMWGAANEKVDRNIIRHPVGSIIKMKERWLYAPDGTPVRYSDLWKRGKKEIPYNPPYIMPAHFPHRRWEVIGVGIRRVFKQHDLFKGNRLKGQYSVKDWDRRWGWPRRRFTNYKITSWEAYPATGSGKYWKKWIVGSPYYDIDPDGLQPLWKGVPLIVHPYPWTTVYKVIRLEDA